MAGWKKYDAESSEAESQAVTQEEEAVTQPKQKKAKAKKDSKESGRDWRADYSGHPKFAKFNKGRS